MNSHISNVRLLYKAILRLHRSLPQDLQELGTDYVRSEFRRHKKCSPMEAQLFMTEWSGYAVDLAKQIRSEAMLKTRNSYGRNLAQEELDKLRDEQIVQLYELMRSSRGEDV